MAYGLYPSNQWQKGQIIQTNYWLENFKQKQGNITLQVEKIDGAVILNKIRSSGNKFDQIPIGQLIEIPLSIN